MSAVAMQRPRVFVVWWHDMDRWVVPSAALLSRKLPDGWIRTRIGDCVNLVSNVVKVAPNADYKMAGVKWYGEGVFHRETVRGDSISARYLSPVVRGALIYNRLFAWKESFAVVPDHLAECFVSNEFPQFVPDPSKVLAQYLHLWCISKQTTKAVNAASTGSAAVSRNRFREQYFLDFEIPLPPLPAQRKIVAAWEAARGRMDSARDGLSRQVFSLDAELRKAARTGVLRLSCLIARWKDLDALDMKSARAAIFRLDNPTFKPLGKFAEEATEIVKPWEDPEKEWPVYGVNNKEGVVFSHYQKGKHGRGRSHRDAGRSRPGSSGAWPSDPES